MSALRVGQTLTDIPELPGTWSVWSLAGGGWGPGAYFVLPDGGRGGHAVIRAVQKKNDPRPTITVLSAPRAVNGDG